MVAIGSLLADRTRVEILTTLMDGRALTSGELARTVGVATSTASDHLGRLLDGGLVTVRAQGRHRYFRLADAQVAALLESLGAVPAPESAPHPRAPAALAYARSCYDHLAGQLGVRVLETLHSRGAVADDGPDRLRVTAAGDRVFASLGVDIRVPRGGSRPLVRPCLDWTERRDHLAGALGAALLTAFLDAGWLARTERPRALRVPRAGRPALEAWLAG